MSEEKGEKVLAIEVEAMLCELLDKQWTTNVSIVGLVEELRTKLDALEVRVGYQKDQIATLEAGQKMVYRRFKQLDDCLDTIRNLAQRKQT